MIDTNSIVKLFVRVPAGTVFNGATVSTQEENIKRNNNSQMTCCLDDHRELKSEEKMQFENAFSSHKEGLHTASVVDKENYLPKPIIKVTGRVQFKEGTGTSKDPYILNTTYYNTETNKKKN
jgi:hypothetical protein